MNERILLAEDDRELREFLTEVLEDAGYRVGAHPTAELLLKEITAGPVDLVITDLIMPGMRGHELLQEVRARRRELNVIVITAFGSIDSAIELVKAGAYDYLTKPFGSDELLLAVERGLAESGLRREVAELARAPGPAPAGFIGASKPMRAIFQLIQRAGPTDRTVLITGESGTGKELVARALHDASGRKPFVVANCAAFPEQLLESELFGHERGAFTGAEREKPGLFEAADGGSIFLDEVGDLPASLQPKLLRALENQEVRRVGSTKSRTVNVRVIAATNKNLEREVEGGRFRDDLFWRLNVIAIEVPPLRERIADVPLLAEHFLGTHRLSRESLALLTAYPWPGNVRELRNAIERARTLSATEEITPDDLPERVRRAAGAATVVADASRKQATLRDLERSYILEVLRQAGGNKTRAADILGLDRKTLYRKLEEYRLAEADEGERPASQR